MQKKCTEEKERMRGDFCLQSQFPRGRWSSLYFPTTNLAQLLPERMYSDILPHIKASGQHRIDNWGTAVDGGILKGLD